MILEKEEEKVEEGREAQYHGLVTGRRKDILLLFVICSFKKSRISELADDKQAGRRSMYR